jgi:PAS domain S-box-containing protein
MVPGVVDAIRLNADLLNALPDGILVTDRKGNMIFASDQLQSLSGYQAEELIGQPVERLVPERDRHRHVQHRSAYFSAGSPIRAMGSGLRIYLLHKDGHEIPVDIALSPIAAEGGPLAVAAVRDATERTRFEQELGESRERFQLLINGVEDYAIFMVDPTGHVMSWNSGAERIKGYTAEEILGLHVSVFYPPDAVADGLPEHSLKVAREAGRFEGEGWRLRKDGRRFWADVVITAVHDESGTLRGFSKVTRDITERKRAQDRLAAATEVGQAILSGEDSEHVLALVCRRARELVDAATAVIAMREAGSSRLEIAVVDGEGAEALRGVRVLDEGPGASVASFEAALRAAGLGPAVVVPLLAGGRSLGTLGLANRPDSAPFSAEAELVIQLFAGQAAVAIEYSNARDELRRLDVMEERERIGRELHDGVIQALFAVGMNLQATALRVGRPELEERLDASVAEIDRAIRDLRNYIFGLRPGILADRQLAQAIQQLAAEVERESGVTMVTDLDPATSAALASAAGDVVQLVRESLSNVARHAEATTCRVSLRTVAGRAVLEIDDDGRGFDPTTGQVVGQGLGNLRARAESMGGELEIGSRNGEGTTITVELPL